MTGGRGGSGLRSLAPKGQRYSSSGHRPKLMKNSKRELAERACVACRLLYVP